METAEREKNTAIQLKESDLKNDFQEQLALKNDEINALKLKSRTELVDEVSKKEERIRALQSQLESAEVKKELALSNAVRGDRKRKRPADQ